MFERREQWLTQTKFERSIDKMEIHRKEKMDVPTAYVNNKDSRKCYFKYKEPAAKTEQFKTYIEKNPKVWPGPQQYWQVRPEKRKFGKKVSAEEKEDVVEVEVDGKTVKQYFIDHKRTDKRIYKPMKTHIF